MTRRPIEAGIRTGDEDGQDAAALRDAYAQWASGVTVVAVRDETGVHGLTVSAFLPLSLDPPLVLVSLAGDAPVLSYLEHAGRFVVNVLAADQRALASRFSDRYPIAPDAFPPAGDPVLKGAAATFVCDLEATYPGGDHRIVVGRVLEARRNDGRPLVYHDRRYGAL